MLYEKKPKNFNPKFDVVSCFIEYNDKIILLHRQDYKPEGNTWGVPAGKINKGEKLDETMVREIKEETGFCLNSSHLSYFKKFYIKYPKYDFVYHIFYSNLDKKQKVNINNKEHKNHKWISPKNALNLPLIRDLDTCIKSFYHL